MITPSAPRLREARADFKELRPLTPVMHLHGAGVPGTIAQLESPDGDAVILMRVLAASSDLAPVIAGLLAAMETKSRTHVIIESHEAAEEGFAAALDEETNGQLRITLVKPTPPDPEIEAAVESVPLPEGRPAVAIVTSISEADVDRIADRYCTGEGKDRFMDRLLPLVGDETVSTHWKLLYWVKGGWSAVMPIREFFQHHEIPYQIARDPADDVYEFAILTDHETPGVRREMARDALRSQMERAKAEASGDPLAALFAAESFDKDSS